MFKIVYMGLFAVILGTLEANAALVENTQEANALENVQEVNALENTQEPNALENAEEMNALEDTQEVNALGDEQQAKALKRATKKLEIIAKSLHTEKDTVSAIGEVIVYYDKTVIRATNATFNKKTKLLTLEGDVEMIGYKGTKEHTQYMEIHTGTKEVNFKELFLASKNDVWVMANKAHRLDGNYTFAESVLSSCEVDDPLWKMYFSSSTYDSNDEYMKVYGAKVYFWDIPIFYSPYLAFSTNNERSSGLLFPMFGYSEEDGFVYEQPIFWAISDSVDLELNPQIRTERSMGIYSTLRFVDSNHSSGKIRIGYFKDKDSFSEQYESNSRYNDTHYGAELNYESTQVFFDPSVQSYTDGLYLNATYLNDVDYLNLQKKSLGHFGLTPLQESRLNYFLHNNEYYMGVNAKYFIDTRKENNDKTIQVLPSVQWHKYLNSLVWNELTYSVDVQVKNLDRKAGSTLQQVEMAIPIEYTTSFFDDAVSLSLKEDLYYYKAFFGNGNYTYDEYEYYNNVSKIKVFTDLTKSYIAYTHALQTSLEYVKPGEQDGMVSDFRALAQKQRDLFSITVPEEHVAFSLSQYVYANKGTKLKFYQRLFQKYYTEREYKYGDVTNEMFYNYNKWKFYNNLQYAPEFSTIRTSSSNISLREKTYSFSVGHTYAKALEDQPKDRPANELSLDFDYSLNQRMKVWGGLVYNIDDEASKQWKFGGSYSRDCWNIAASIRQDIKARATGPEKENTFYLQMNFVPFGGIGTNTFNTFDNIE